MKELNIVSHNNREVLAEARFDWLKGAQVHEAIQTLDAKTKREIRKYHANSATTQPGLFLSSTATDLSCKNWSDKPPPLLVFTKMTLETKNDKDGHLPLGLTNNNNNTV